MKKTMFYYFLKVKMNKPLELTTNKQIKEYMNAFATDCGSLPDGEIYEQLLLHFNLCTMHMKTNHKWWHKWFIFCKGKLLQA